MPLLYHDVGDARLVIFLQLDTGVPDGQKLVVQNLKRDQNPSHTESLSIYKQKYPDAPIKKLNK